MKLKILMLNESPSKKKHTKKPHILFQSIYRKF